MGLLNLALGQLFGLFLPLAAFLVALYFYDRSRRRVVVSTLQFWPRLPAPPVRRRHRRIQHPLSLVLQLVAMLLLLLAIADPRPEAGGRAARQVVVLLDTSAAMAAAAAGGEGLMDEAKALALSYVDRARGSDRILLIEADGSPAVQVPFTSDRQRLREAILAAEPGWTALDLGAALNLAAGTLRLALDADGRELPAGPGGAEVAYIGPGRIDGQTVRSGVLPLVRFIETSEPADSVGLLALRASSDETSLGRWDVELVARNYGTDRQTVRVEFLFNERVLGHRDLDMPAGEESDLRFTLRTQRPGRLVARTAEADEFDANNQAAIDIPPPRRIPLQVLDGSEEALGPLLASGARVQPSFVRSTDELDENAIHVWARGGEAMRSRRAIVLAPPGTASPAGEASSARVLPIDEWSASHPLAAGIRDRDMAPRQARIFEVQAGDEVVAGTSQGPVILARASGQRKLVAFGFDLADDSVRRRLAAPLLFANAVDWLDSGAFRAELVEARSPGTVEIEAPNSTARDIAVRDESGDAVPWVLTGGRVRFHAGESGTYRAITQDSDVRLFMSQPDIAGASWEPPEDVPRGLPPARGEGGGTWLPWPWLAALAGLILAYDWVRFGRGRPLSAGAFAKSEAGADGWAS